MYVVVEKLLLRQKRSAEDIDISELFDSTGRPLSQDSAYIAAALDPSAESFTVGDDEYYGGFHNAPVRAGNTYDMHTYVTAKIQVN